MCACVSGVVINAAGPFVDSLCGMADKEYRPMVCVCVWICTCVCVCVDVDVDACVWMCVASFCRL